MLELTYHPPVGFSIWVQVFTVYASTVNLMLVLLIGLLRLAYVGLMPALTCACCQLWFANIHVQNE